MLNKKRLNTHIQSAQCFSKALNSMQPLDLTWFVNGDLVHFIMRMHLCVTRICPVSHMTGVVIKGRFGLRVRAHSSHAKMEVGQELGFHKTRSYKDHQQRTKTITAKSGLFPHGTGRSVNQTLHQS